MKTLYVLRHGHAVPESEASSDHARELSPRGRAEVRRSAQQLSRRSSLPSVVLTSNAARALATAELCLTTWSPRPEPPQLRVTERLYLAGPSSYVEELSEAADPHQVAMVVGHNPGLEALVYVLTEHSEHLATASVVEIELPIVAWSDLSGAGRHAGRVVSSFHASR
ncbi:MAG TPA: histidine phosphatase family protein [Polyangiaceae bacterium]